MPSKRIKATSRSNDDSYLKFLTDLQLIGLGLKNNTATLNRTAFFKLMEGEDRPTRHLSEAYAPSTIGEDFFDAEGRYEVKIGDGNDVVLHLQFVFEVHMHAPAPVTKDMAERFAKTDLRFILLPYAREFVTSITAQMQIPPVVLPLATAAGKARPIRHRQRVPNPATAPEVPNDRE